MQNCKNYARQANFTVKTLRHTSIFNNFARIKDRRVRQCGMVRWGGVSVWLCAVVGRVL